MFFFFKQKTAYEMRISDWSSDVCSSDLLFGEGHVDGLRAIFDHETLIDPENPEYGPVANQLVVNDAANEGRSALINRFAQQSFGTVNRSNHGSYCGKTRCVGAAAALGDLPGMPHGTPDSGREHV